MSLQDGLRHFLDGVDPTILDRGENYYHSGQVESVIWDENHVTAEVSGSEDEPYLVEIAFSEDGEVEDCSCDCPYEWDPVCKHTVAVLLDIQVDLSEGLLKRHSSPEIDIRPLLERAKRRSLPH